MWLGRSCVIVAAGFQRALRKAFRSVKQKKGREESKRRVGKYGAEEREEREEGREEREKA